MKYGYARVSTAQQKKGWEQPGGTAQPAPARRVRFYRRGAIYRGTDGPSEVPEALFAAGKRGHAGGVQTRSVCQNGGGGSCHLSGADAEGSAHPHPQHGCDRGHPGRAADSDNLPGFCGV